jgi:hypothetical protein
VVWNLFRSSLEFKGRLAGVGYSEEEIPAMLFPGRITLANPAQETATLDIQLDQPAIVTLRVYATDGRLVDERNFGKTDSVQENILKAEYPAGLYLADVQAGSFRKTIRWVVK